MRREAVALASILLLTACGEQTPGTDTNQNNSNEDPVCGDNLAEPQEDCDGTDLGGQSCESLGFWGGTLRCRETCQLDWSDCILLPRICGNDIADPTEECDGRDVKGQTCADFGFENGNLVVL